MDSLDTANQRYAIPGRLRFEALAPGFVAAVIDNPMATATISLQGGQLLAWQPKDQADPVIWLSKLARFVHGSAIRGGIPVCWPWFDAHPQDEGLPAHGIARISPWRLVSTASVAGGATALELALEAGEETSAALPPGLSASLRFTVGERLEVALMTTNGGATECEFSEALHSYFHIGDIAAVRVLGLDDRAYIDKLRARVRLRQRGPVVIDGEIDNVYVDARESCTIEDSRLGRQIRIDKSGSGTTVVWSPGAARAGAIADIGPEAWRRMLCVETANALDNRLRLAPGERHTLALACSVARL